MEPVLGQHVGGQPGLAVADPGELAFQPL